MAYLAGTINHGLLFRPGDQLVGYTDADYAGDSDTRRSTSGFIFLMNTGPVAWSSRRQNCTALSTTEAEFAAACEAAKEAVWILNALMELGEKTPKPLELWCDNQSAIRVVHNPELHPKTKHIDVKYHFVRDKQTEGTLDVKYVCTNNQLADIFTKPLPAPRFERLREEIGVVKRST